MISIIFSPISSYICELCMIYCIILLHRHYVEISNVDISKYKFSNYFAKQMNLQEIFSTQTLCTQRHNGVKSHFFLETKRGWGYMDHNTICILKIHKQSFMPYPHHRISSCSWKYSFIHLNSIQIKHMQKWQSSKLNEVP